MTNRRAIPITALQTLYRVLTEPTAITFKGQVVGMFIPASVPDDSARHGRGVGAYRPEPTPELELAKLAMESAWALSETESLLDMVRPDATGARRGMARESAFLSRRLYLAHLREQHAKEQSE